MKTHTHAHTRTLHHYHCFSWRRVSAFVCNYRGLKWEGRIFKKRMDGKEEKNTKRAGQKTLRHTLTHTQTHTHPYVCDILVTFYRNCCSTPSHTCKKRRKKKYFGNVLCRGWLPRFCLVCSVQRAKGALWLAGMALKTLQLRVGAYSAS